MLRVMLDTNILISALFYPSVTTGKFFEVLLTDHRAILCNYVIAELRRVAREKFSQRAAAVDVFLEDFPHDTVKTPKTWDASLVPAIRDEKDAAILATAILEKADIIVTGDKDFLVLDIPQPRIMTMAEFITIYDSRS